MNWYKISQEDFGNIKKTYYDIGHDNPGYLWVYLNNEIKVILTLPSETRRKTHRDLFEDISAQTYRGRFDSVNKSLSIVNPFLKYIPEIILGKLYQEFGNDIKIYEF